jgi:hypothetical protein
MRSSRQTYEERPAGVALLLLPLLLDSSARGAIEVPARQQRTGEEARVDAAHEPIALRNGATVPLRGRDPRGITLGMANPELSRDELEVALRARGELDRELEPHVIDAFLDRVERNIDARVDARLQARGEVAVDRAKPSQGSSPGTVILPLGSMFLGVLATAAVADLGSATAQVVIAIVAWIAIVAVNVVYAARR